MLFNADASANMVAATEKTRIVCMIEKMKQRSCSALKRTGIVRWRDAALAINAFPPTPRLQCKEEDSHGTISRYRA